MIPELGLFAVILAFLLAATQATLSLVGAQRGNATLMAVARPAAQGQFLFMVVAFGCLAYSFLVNDFSVLNVAENSFTELPKIYRFTATWGSHEGSMLLWTLILSLWTFAVTLWSRHLPEDMSARVLGVMGLVSTGFLVYVLLASNPFLRLIPAPTNGNDLNPLLQDPGMVFHPPMLYMGYVGFSVAFAFAIAAGRALFPGVLGVRLPAILAAAGFERDDIRVLFTTHSIPTAMAATSGPPGRFDVNGAYVAQHRAAIEAVLDEVRARGGAIPVWSLVYQSRSGSPHVPWLEPDINDALRDAHTGGMRAAIVVPIGFVSDHVEVVWDLDHELAATAAGLGVRLVRVPTVGSHPVFLDALAELVQAHLTGTPPEPAGPAPLMPS